MANIIAMIPARLGSKRIPKKNIRYLGDKPLILYPIQLCQESGLFSQIWVNTESPELGKVAESLGVGFHCRPAELAGDTATNRDFTYEFLQKHPCDYVVMVNSTSPLLRLETMTRFLHQVEKGEADTILSVIAEREETFFRGEPLNFTLQEKINSQLLEPVEKIVWALTAWKRETFLTLQDQGKNPVFGGRVARFQIPKDESCDLDTEEDWRIAEGAITARAKILGKARYMEL